MIVEGKGQFWGECGASRCNQWDGDALFPNYFGENFFLLQVPTTFDLYPSVFCSIGFRTIDQFLMNLEDVCDEAQSEPVRPRLLKLVAIGPLSDRKTNIRWITPTYTYTKSVHYEIIVLKQIIKKKEKKHQRNISPMGLPRHYG